MSTITQYFDFSQGLTVVSSQGSQKYTENLDSYSQLISTLKSAPFDSKHNVQSCWETGNIYFANTGNGDVKKLSFDGTEIATLSLSAPVSISVIQASNVMATTVTVPPQEDRGCWIADSGTDRVYKTDNALNILYQNDTFSSVAQAVTYSDGTCYVADANEISRLSANGEKEYSITYSDLDITTFSEMAVDNNRVIWVMADDKIYSLGDSGTAFFLRLAAALDPLGAGDPFSSSSSENPTVEEEHIGTMDIDRQETEQFLYVAGGNSEHGWVIKYYSSGTVKADKEYYNFGFIYVLRVIQGLGSTSIYVLSDDTQWDVLEYGSSSSSEGYSSSSSSSEGYSSSSSSEGYSSSSSSSEGYSSSSSVDDVLTAAGFGSVRVNQTYTLFDYYGGKPRWIGDTDSTVKIRWSILSSVWTIGVNNPEASGQWYYHQTGGGDHPFTVVWGVGLLGLGPIGTIT